MHRKLTIISLFAILFAFAPQNSHAQRTCGDVNPDTATAIDCTSTTGDATLNITDGLPSVVTDGPVVTVNSATGSANLTSSNATTTTTRTDGDAVVIGGATDATFRGDNGSFTVKNGSDGNVATITAGTGVVNVDIHNTTRVKIGGTGGNGIIATSTVGKVDVDISTKGLIFSDQSGTNGLIANTTSGDIDFTLADEKSYIHMVINAATRDSTRRDELLDTRGATLTSAGGAITVEITNSAAIVASSVGNSYGLAATTGGTGSISMVLANDTACIVGKDGIIASTAIGDINLALANGIVYGRGGKGSIPTGGNGIIAKSTSGGDINIGGNGGSVLWADGAGSIAIEASTTGTGTLSVVAGQDNGLSVWTEGGFAAINASTVNVVDADIGGNGSDFAILATGDVDVSGADVWTNKTGATTISAAGANVWNASKVRATGATANAISATTVVVNGSEVWTTGGTSNSIVADTVNASNDAKVWSNASGSSAISAKAGGGVTVVSRDGKGEVWSNASGSSTVKATTTAGIHGLKVWSNGVTSQAVTAATVTINGTAEVWANGDTSNTIVATGTANIWNGAKVWSNGATSNTVKAATVIVNGTDTHVWANGATSNAIVGTTVNVSNLGKVWASGTDSSAVSAETGGGVTIVSADGTGEIWTTLRGVPTVKATTTAEINDLKVWANGSASQAVTAATATVNGAQVWTEGSDSDTIQAPTVNIWNRAKVWANGSTSNAVEGTTVLVDNSEVWTTQGIDANTIVAATVNVSGGGKVWANGVDSSAVAAKDGTTVNIISRDGDGEIWTMVGGVSTVKGTTAYINDGVSVWANGAGSNAVAAATAVTVNGASSVWTIGGGSQTIISAAGTVGVYGSSKVWSNGGGTTETINARTVTVNGSGTEVWAEGPAGDAIVATGSRGIVNVYGGSVWTNGSGSKAIQGRGGASVRVNGSSTKVWTLSDDSQTIFVRDNREMFVENEAKVWSNGGRSETLAATGSGSSIKVNNAEVWEEGSRSGAVSSAIQTTLGASVAIENEAKVWSNGVSGRAISITQGGGGITVNGSQVWSQGAGASTIYATGSHADIFNESKIWSNGATSNAIVSATVAVNNSEVWTETTATASNAIVAGTVNVSGGGKVWANGTTSSAVAARTGTVNIVSTDGDGQVWTTVGGVQTVKGATAYINDGVKVWANGAGSQAVSATTTATVNSTNTQVWTEGNTTDTIVAPTVNIWNEADVWANGVTSNTVTATTSVTVNNAKVWSNGATSNTVVTATLNVSNEGKVWAEGTGSSAVSAGVSGTVNIVADDATGKVWTTVGGVQTVKATTAYINDGVKVWANGTGSQAVSATTIATVNSFRTEVWTEGDTTDTIKAPTVNIWNRAKVWANGSTSNAVEGTTVLVDNSEVWTTQGSDANTIVAATVNVSGGGRVWANGVDSSAVAAKDGTTVNIISVDGGGEVWTTVGGVSTVKATTAYINDGVKVWANGTGSRAASATTVTVNSAETEVWTEGDTTDTITAPTVTIWNSAKVWANGATSNAASATTSVTVNGASVWSNGATSNAIVTATLNVSNEGKVWASGASTSSAVSAGASGTVSIVADDATGQIWTTLGGARTVKATAAYINDGVKVWANGAESRAVSAGSSATVNGTDTQVWTEGNTTDTIASAAISIWNGAKVWANGAASNAVRATTVVTVNGAGTQVWAEADVTGTVADFASDGLLTFTTEGEISAAIVSDQLVTVEADAQVWANGAGGRAVISPLLQANGAKIWTQSLGGSVTVETQSADISNGTELWAETTLGDSEAIALVQLDADSTEILLNLRGSDVWTNGPGATTISFYEAGTTADIDIASSNVWTNSAGDGSAAISAYTLDGAIGMDVVSSNVSAFYTPTPAASGYNPIAISTIAFWNGVSTVNVTDSNVWAGDADDFSPTAISVNSESGGVADMTVRDSNVFSNSAGATAIYASATKRATNASLVANLTDARAADRGITNLHINSSTVTVTLGEGTAVEVATYNGGNASAEIANGTDIIALGADSKGIFAHAELGGSPFVSVNGSNVTAMGVNSAAISLLTEHAGETLGEDAITGLARFNGTDLFDLEANGTFNLKIENSTTLSVLFGIELGETRLVVDSGVTSAEVVNGANVSARGLNSVAADVSTMDGGISTLSVREGAAIWTTGANSSAVKLSTVDGENTETQFSTAITRFDASQAWTNGANSTVFEADAGEGPIVINIDNGTEVWVEGDNSVVFDLTAGAGYGVELAVHNSVVGINSQDGEILKIAGSDDDITVTSTNSSFRSGDSVTGPLFSASVETSDATVKIRDFTISGKSNIGITEIDRVWTTGENAVAFDFAHSSADPAAVGTYFDPRQVWSEGVDSGAIRIETVSGEVSLETGAQIWSNGSDTATISVRRVAAASSSVPRSSSHDSSNRIQHFSGFPTVDVGAPTEVKFSAPDGETAQVWAEGLSSSAIHTWLSGLVLEDARVWSNSSGGNTVKIVAAALDQQLQVGNGAIVCGGVLSGTTCTETAAVNAVHFSIDSGSTAGIGITTHSDGNITGRIQLAGGADTFINEGDFTGSGDTGGGNDTITIKSGSTFTLTGNLDLGAGDGDTVTTETGSTLTVGSFMFENAETTPSAGGTGRFRLSSGAQSSPASGGGARFSLSAIDPASEDTHASIDFGEGGNDRFISNGTTVIEGADGFTGLESIKFGEGATLVVSASSGEMADKPLIDIEGTITAEDLPEDFNIRLGAGLNHGEYVIFASEDLPENPAEIYERLGADENGFVTLAANNELNLQVYDALIQSAYYSDRYFGSHLRKGCGGGASVDGEGVVSGGCVWALSGGRFTRHSPDFEFDETAYSFVGGVSMPFAGIATSLGFGYEASSFDVTEENSGGVADADFERFMFGLFASKTIFEKVQIDGRFEFAQGDWSSSRTDMKTIDVNTTPTDPNDDSRFDGRFGAKTDARTYGGAAGAEMSFDYGEFTVIPRIETGITYIETEQFVESFLGQGTDTTNTGEEDNKLTVNQFDDILIYATPSVSALYSSNDTLTLSATLGVDAHILNPESDIKATIGDDEPVNTTGTLERINIKVGAGAEITPTESVTFTLNYDGGASAGFDTVTHAVTGRLNVAF